MKQQPKRQIIRLNSSLTSSPLPPSSYKVTSRPELINWMSDQFQDSSRPDFNKLRCLADHLFSPEHDFYEGPACIEMIGIGAESSARAFRMLLRKHYVEAREVSFEGRNVYLNQSDQSRPMKTIQYDLS